MTYFSFRSYYTLSSVMQVCAIYPSEENSLPQKFQPTLTSNEKKRYKLYPFEELLHPRLFCVHVFWGDPFNVAHGLYELFNSVPISVGKLGSLLRPSPSMSLDFASWFPAQRGLILNMTCDQLFEFGMPLWFTLFVGAECLFIGSFNNPEEKWEFKIGKNKI